DVEASELSDGLADRIADVLLDRDVAHNRDRLAAARPEVIRSAGNGVRVQSHDRDRRSLRDKSLRDGITETPPASGHDGDSLLQPVHGHASSSMRLGYPVFPDPGRAAARAPAIPRGGKAFLRQPLARS